MDADEDDEDDGVWCIRDTHVIREGLSWCDRILGPEPAFVSIDHAALNGRAGGRLTVCPECAARVVQVLTNGMGD